MLVNVGPRPQPSVENLGEWPRPRVGTAGPLSYKVDLATPTQTPQGPGQDIRETERQQGVALIMITRLGWM